MTIFDYIKNVGFVVGSNNYRLKSFIHENYYIKIISEHNNDYFYFYELGTLIIGDENIDTFDFVSFFDVYFKSELRENKINNLLK